MNGFLGTKSTVSACRAYCLLSFFIENVPFEVYSAVSLPSLFEPLFAKKFYGWEAKGSLLQFSTYFHPLHVQP